ncbi:MAG: sulfotransferase family protein, partial [Thermomicrobiales bacterium]|nr:sulfotransferase family protein [Thermomicrobiales bacterium]
MTLQVIGAGFVRPGAYSLKAALERLGFDPCEHMIDLFAHPERFALWLQAAEQKQ